MEQEQATRQLRMVNRQGEQGVVPHRRKRLFMKHTRWYFMTRNGPENGPYQNLTEAKRELALFLRRSGIVRFTV